MNALKLRFESAVRLVFFDLPHRKSAGDLRHRRLQRLKLSTTATNGVGEGMEGHQPNRGQASRACWFRHGWGGPSIPVPSEIDSAVPLRAWMLACGGASSEVVASNTNVKIPPPGATDRLPRRSTNGWRFHLPGSYLDLCSHRGLRLSTGRQARSYSCTPRGSRPFLELFRITR